MLVAPGRAQDTTASPETRIAHTITMTSGSKSVSPDDDNATAPVNIPTNRTGRPMHASPEVDDIPLPANTQLPPRPGPMQSTPMQPTPMMSAVPYGVPPHAPNGSPPVPSVGGPIPTPGRFVRETNGYLRHLSRTYHSCQRVGDDAGVLSAVAAADMARRAHAVHSAIIHLAHDYAAATGNVVAGLTSVDGNAPHEAVALHSGVKDAVNARMSSADKEHGTGHTQAELTLAPEYAAAPTAAGRSAQAGVSMAYLAGAASRLFDAMRRRDVVLLERTVLAAEEALEHAAAGNDGPFAEVDPIVWANTAMEVEEENRKLHPTATKRNRTPFPFQDVYDEGGDPAGNIDDIDGMPTMEDVRVAAALKKRKKHARFALTGRARERAGTRAAGLGDAAGTQFDEESGDHADIVDEARAAELEREAISHVIADRNKRSRRSWLPFGDGIRWSALDKPQKCTIGLYLLMVLFSVVALGIITAEFVNNITKPDGVINVENPDSLIMPVLTVCLAQPGVPMSRLQLFNYTTGDGRFFIGSNPDGPYDQVIPAEFGTVVDRFFDNPDGEDCLAVVGDYYPFPLQSLNDIAAGRKTTNCRPCFRTGASEPIEITSTNFSDAANAKFFTDSYFMECMFREGGLEQTRSLPFVQNSVFLQREKMDEFQVLLATNGSVAELSKPAFETLTSEQLCNLMYFSFFPKAVGLSDDSVDIVFTYDVDSGDWSATGAGPYFEVPKQELDLLPTEALQMFVSPRETTPDGVLSEEKDMALIGPNSQAFAKFTPIEIFNETRYDIAISSSNFVHNDILPRFGYWYLYDIYFNFNRILLDRIFSRVSYTWTQWLIDFFGYLSLFTGLSFFSCLLVPVLHSVHKRQRRQILEEKPEALVWEKYRRMPVWRHGRDDVGPAKETGPPVRGKGTTVRNVMLP